MTVELTSERSPGEVLEATRAFFLGPEAYEDAWLETESETHLGFGTFRGQLAVAAFPDPRGEAPTRVRISTLREEGIVPRLRTYLETLGFGEDEPGDGVGDEPAAADPSDESPAG